MKAKDKTDPALDEATSEEYDAFEELARKLVSVPKREIDTESESGENGHR